MDIMDAVSFSLTMDRNMQPVARQSIKLSISHGLWGCWSAGLKQANASIYSGYLMTLGKGGPTLSIQNQVKEADRKKKEIEIPPLT